MIKYMIGIKTTANNNKYLWVEGRSVDGASLCFKDTWNEAKCFKTEEIGDCVDHLEETFNDCIESILLSPIKCGDGENECD